MAARRSRIYVLTATNGAGKSSIVGAMLREAGADYFNPDEAAQRIRSANPGLTQADANSAAWHQGHDIPEADIRRRWETGRLNAIRLLPKLTELRVYDNSGEADPDSGTAPTPVLVLHVRRGRIVAPRDLRGTPAWAKPIVAAALRLSS